MKQANHQQFFLLDEDKTYQSRPPFILQPIVNVNDGLVFGLEILYRGGVPADWAPIDHSVLQHLHATRANTLPTLFVNLCDQAFLDTAPEFFIALSQQHRIYFEMSQPQADTASRQRIAAKMHLLAAQGVRFALDDYNSDQDDLRDVVAIDCLSMIKFDGALIMRAMHNASTAAALRQLLASCRADGIASVAECIETSSMLEFVQQMAFDFAQGFHIDAMLNGLEGQDLRDT